LPEFIKQIGAARFGVMAGIAAALTAFFLYVAGAITEPAKSVLFSGLDPRDASAVTGKLDSMNEKYELRGDTILVPSDDVTKLRMTLAADNLPSAGVGYEIFDKSDTFGTTAFVQNINKLRALEGELARSIQTIEGVDSVRVHLVIPEHQIFSQNNDNPTASVVLKTHGVMGRGQVQAIQHLVAAAVAGLSAERVAIVDDKGNLLAGGDGKDGPNALAIGEATQTSGFEDTLRSRVQSIVESIVGPGHVRVQVTADMDYKHENTVAETFDPNSKVLRSTQTVDSTNTDANSSNGAAVSVGSALPGGATPPTSGDGSHSNASRTEETNNYEINRTTTTSTVDGGTLKRLSVAVVVDGTQSDGGKYTPRTPAEMKQIDDLVKSTVGFSTQRGDIVQVDNMEFARLDAGDAAPPPAPLLGMDSTQWVKIIEVAILSLAAIILGFFVGRPMIARMFAPNARSAAAGGSVVAGVLPAPGSPAAMLGAPAALPAPGGTTARGVVVEGEAPLVVTARGGIDLSQIQGGFGDNSVKKVGEVVSAHPEEALAIIRTWLHQPA
jgi:flagellar M-ring protein FliF